MTYENSLEFGKKASLINEAYSKMYKRGGKCMNRMIVESDEPSDDEMLKNDMTLSKEQREYMKNFDAEKEYRDIRSRAKKGDDDEVDIAPKRSRAVNATSQRSTLDDEDEDTENFMSSFTAGSERDDSRRKEDDDDFVFGFSRYDDKLRQTYPDWLRKAAEKAGHKLRITQEVPTRFDGHGAKRAAVVTEVPKEGAEPEAFENIWHNIVEAHPEVFNDDRYDMEELKKHRREFAEKWEKYFNQGYGEVEAAERAFEEIPGCECKEKPVEDEFIGVIDDEDVEDEPAKETMTSPWEKDGFGVVIRYYERDWNSDSEYKEYNIRWVTPKDLQGVHFDTKEDAINALRDTMVENFVGNPDEVYIGVVIDHTLANQHFNEKDDFDTYEDLVDDEGNVVKQDAGWAAGKAKRHRKMVDSKVYLISSSDKENTDLVVKYAGGDSKRFMNCDEYLQ